MKLCHLTVATAVAISLSPAIAVAAEDVSTPQDDRHHPTELEGMEVTATPLADTVDTMVLPVEVLAGEQLDEARGSTLGETTNKLPGVQTSYFGPGVGRPIIRGFDAARVEILSDGLGTGDASTTSADHGVSIEPFLADRIEVLKGPATLLYGSGAIGGAVNVIDGRVPQSKSIEPLQGRAELRTGTVNEARIGMLRLDGTSGNMVFHFDAMHRDTADYAIPGYAESAHQRAQESRQQEEHGDHAGQEHHEEQVHGVLPNSAVRTSAGSVGMSWIGDQGFFGAALSSYDSRYGIPGHSHGHHPGHEQEDHAEKEHEAVHIDMEQSRAELRGGLDRIGPFETLRVKFARTDYAHTEYEGKEVGTVFHNVSKEGRLELVHRPVVGWNGAFGLQSTSHDFHAVGAEAFVPPTATRNTGIFWVGNREFGRFKLQLGARRDRNRIELTDRAISAGDAMLPDRAFDTTSGSAALRWNVSEALHLSFGLDRVQRAPAAEELYSAGLHVATASFEVGNAALDVETANRAELGLHWHADSLQIGASIYQARFDDFIYQADSGVELEGTPIRLWTQQDASFRGAEAKLDWIFANTANGSWSMHLFADVVRAELDGSGTRVVPVVFPHQGRTEEFTAPIANSGNLPRIVPPRIGASLGWETITWRASLGAVRYAEQDHVAANETITPGYTMVDAHLAWHADTAAGTGWEIFLDGNNLLNEEARVHNSFLKHLAPLPGRNVEFGVRAFF